MSRAVSLNGRLVGEGYPVYVIAEGGLTNWGDIELAKRQVDAAMAAGCDAIKFQAQTTEELVSKVADPYWYRRLKYKELSHEKLRELWEYCSIRNIECFITAHTDIDLEFLDKDLNVPFFKIGSGESQNREFLENVGSRGKPVIISLGLHLTKEEVKASIDALERGGCKDIVILHCNTVYPTPPAMSDLAMIGRLREWFEYPIGYSDHTVGWHIPLASIALGATVLEKHLSFDKNDKRSFDCAVSTTPDELKEMVIQIRDVESALQDTEGLRAGYIVKARQWAQQSIVAATNIKEGSEITRSMLTFKRPGKGLTPDQVGLVLGKRAARDIAADEIVTIIDVTERTS